MIARRDQFNGDANQQLCPVRVTTMPGCSLIAFAARGEAAALIIRDLIGLLVVVVSGRIAGVSKVFYCGRPTSLLVST